MALVDSLLLDELLASEIKPIKEVFLAIRTDGPPSGTATLGDGTRENPFDASTALKFDKIVRDRRGAGNVVFRLGPGLFRTQGGETPGAENPLRIFSGTRFVGAGMFNTTLRLTAELPTDEDARDFPVIAGDGAVDNVEISDLTIDCDLGNQPKYAGWDYARMALKAVELVGKNNRIRRVRIINFGTRTPGFLNGAPPVGGSAESFPIWNAGEGAVTEDCIVEQPFLGTARETTVMVMNGPCGVARNCYLNTEFVNPRNGFATRITSVINIGTVPTAPDNCADFDGEKDENLQQSEFSRAVVASWNSSLSMHDGDPITDMEDSLIGLL